MKSWDTICFLFMSLSYNVTIIGKIWLTLVVLMRLTVILLAAYPLYEDAQFRFDCHTMQPGCTTMCYDSFAPVSHFRFWLVETMSVLLPYAVFSVYVLHSVIRQVVKASALPEHRYKENKSSSGQKATNKSSKDVSRRRIACGSNEMDIPDFSRAYAIQLLLRILIEVSFVVADYSMFGFFIPKCYTCKTDPCPHDVECYVSRPSEKSIMLSFMWILSGFSFLLSLIDLVFAFRTVAVRNRRNRLLLEWFELEDKCSPALHQGDKPGVDLLRFGNVYIADDGAIVWLAVRLMKAIMKHGMLKNLMHCEDATNGNSHIGRVIS